MNDAGPVLRDIHLPPAPWWPPAPGWWALAALAVLLALAVAWWLQRRTRSSIAQLVQREITLLESNFTRSQDTAALAAGASRLLRRVALRIEPAAAVAAGDSWRAFLHRRAGNDQVAAVLDTLATASFQRHPPIDAARLLEALRSWCLHALRASHPTRELASRGKAAR